MEKKTTFIKWAFFFLLVCHINLLSADNVALQWNQAALNAIKVTNMPPPIAARALAIVHTSMFDAWAAYDKKAISTRRGDTLRRPSGERSLSNKKEAISYAAFRALIDLFPSQESAFTTLMNKLGYDASNASMDSTTPAGIGNISAYDILNFRHFDGANQLGNEPGSSGTPYSDYSGYKPRNTPSNFNQPNHWQPLNINGTDQKCLVPHWGLIIPFAINSGDAFLPHAPIQHPDSDFEEQAEELIKLSANLDDLTKAIAEYWADGAGTVTPPGHWNQIAQFVSRRDNHSLDGDIKLLFMLNNALFDASIAVWFVKDFYDSPRPISAIRFLFKDKKIRAWGGPGEGKKVIQGKNWMPYLPTPPFPDYVSGHSTFSSAAAEILTLVKKDDSYGGLAIILKGSSMIEPGLTPSRNIALKWKTFKEAAEQAGYSRRVAGIHFKEADIQGRKMGEKIGQAVFKKASYYIRGGND